MNPFHSVVLILIFACSSCSNVDDSLVGENAQQRYQKGEYIYRLHNEHPLVIPLSEKKNIAPYPWEEGATSHHAKITKEYFRCKGSSLNPVHTEQQKGELVRYFDCGGSEKHSLPLRDGKEFIYPILIDLLNYIQANTNKKVVITSGHRCPEHNVYVDSSVSNQSSKHLIGAEVSFYVQGMEDRPEAIIKLIQEYYKSTGKYKGQQDFVTFQRYEKGDLNVSTQPWYNKEIFVKLFRKKEGRNFDNRHPYPYVSIQVRYDWDTQQKVIYSWDQAFRNYLRH